MQYNNILCDIAANDPLTTLVYMYSLPTDCYSDGVHLNNKGYKKMALRLADAIDKERGWRQFE